MQDSLNSYCKGCDQFSAPHRRRDDGQWVCEDCGHLVECSDPQWSDNCDGDLTTAYEVKKGLCEGCMAVIDSWSEDGDADDGPEQAKLVTDGGTESLQDPLDELVGETHIAVECMVPETAPEFCDGWCESYDLEDPAYKDGYGKIHLPGVSLECGECGQMHDFKINGVGVHFP